jgi:L-fuconate dehydratase
MVAITSFNVLPVAVPPTGFGGDARNIIQGGPTYANAVLEVETDQPGLRGSSIIFTNGHGLREMCEFTESVAQRFLRDRQNPIRLDELHLNGNLGKLSRALLRDSDYGWLGGAGVSRMAIGAVVNVLWDLTAKQQRMPAWRLIVDMAPEDLLQFIDFEWIGDVLSPAEAMSMLASAQTGKQQRIEDICELGLLAYNTVGWSGIGRDGLIEQTRRMIRDRWSQIKIKVGAGYARARQTAENAGEILDRRHLDRLATEAADEDAERLLWVYDTIYEEDQRPVKMKVAVDSNQVFDTRSAVVFVRQLAEKLYQANPEFKIDWFEEPTSPHSALGHLHIQQQLRECFKDRVPPLHVPISTGEQAAAPVFFKDLIHGPSAVGAVSGKCTIDVIQMDYSRVGGIGDNLAILLLAQKARMEGRDLRICPHAGGIGLCEGVRHIQAIKEALFGSTNNAGREDILEYVAEDGRSLHQDVFENPAIIKDGYYQMPDIPGVGVDYTEDAIREYTLPMGDAWRTDDSLAELAQRFMLVGESFPR